MRLLTWVILLSCMTYKAESQTIVASPKNMFLVYNNMGNYFYLKIDGTEKSTTEIDNMYIVDGKTVQVLTIKKSNFLPDSLTNAKPKIILEEYFKFEKEYLDTLFNGEITFTTEFNRLKSGREYIFWSFQSPLLSSDVKSSQDSTTYVDSQLYAATEVGNLIVAVSSPYFKKDIDFSNLKQFLIDIIASITISPTKIDILELDKRINNY